MFKKLLLFALLSTSISIYAKPAESVKDFAVTVKSAEIICVNGVSKLVIMLDQSLRDVERASGQYPPAPNSASKTTLADSYQKNDSYLLLENSCGTRFYLSNMGQSLSLDYQNLITFTITGLVNPKAEKYKGGFSLVSRGLKLAKGELSSNPLMIQASISDSCNSVPRNLPEPAIAKTADVPDVFGYVKQHSQKPNDADNPQVKVTFAIDGTRTTKRYFQTELALEPFSVRRLGMHGAYGWTPFFLNLEKNGNPESEVDKFKFGTKFNHFYIFNDDGRRLSNREPRPSKIAGIKSELNFRIETTTKFKVANLISGIKTGLPLNVFQSRSHSLRITPFIGFDLGYRIRDENPLTKEKWIARPVYGTELYWTPFRTEKLNPFEIEVSFIRRIFLRPELVYNRDADRKKQIEGLTRNPKDFFSFKMNFFKNQLFSPYVQYTHGRDAPEYLLEDNHYRAGLEFKVDWRKKE